MIRTRHTFDFCVPELKLAIEIQGGIWGRGRHVRPQGYHDDRVKIRKAMLQGWIVLEYTTIDLKENNAEAMILEVVEYLNMLRGEVYTYGSKGDFISQIIPAKQLILPFLEAAS